MSTFEMIIDDLKALPAVDLAAVAEYVHRLREKKRSDHAAAIEKSSALLSDAQGEELARIIEKGCETIDARDW
jgi:DTW domain-containing protein YfiP